MPTPSSILENCSRVSTPFPSSSTCAKRLLRPLICAIHEKTRGSSLLNVLVNAFNKHIRHPRTSSRYVPSRHHPHNIKTRDQTRSARKLCRSASTINTYRVDGLTSFREGLQEGQHDSSSSSRHFNKPWLRISLTCSFRDDVPPAVNKPAPNFRRNVSQTPSNSSSVSATKLRNSSLVFDRDGREQYQHEEAKHGSSTTRGMQHFEIHKIRTKSRSGGVYS